MKTVEKGGKQGTLNYGGKCEKLWEKTVKNGEQLWKKQKITKLVKKTMKNNIWKNNEKQSLEIQWKTVNSCKERCKNCVNCLKQQKKT